MVKNEKYLKFLKSMISCVSHGDYGAIKELSNMELKKMELNNKKIAKDIKKARKYKLPKKYKNMPLKEWESKQLTNLIEEYSKYILNKIDTTEDIKELKQDAISVHEFIDII